MTPPRRVRRWPLAVGCGMFAAAAAGAGLGWHSAASINDSWRRDAALADAATEQWRIRAAELEDDLTDAGRRLQASQADALVLQSRLDDLAAEKASAIDDIAKVDTVAETLARLVSLTGSATTQLQRCVDAQAEWVRVLDDQLVNDAVYVDAELAAFERRMDEICIAARSLADQAVAELEDL